jgi:ABC-type spermidine/putrescine transport system permease subunit I
MVYEQVVYALDWNRGSVTALILMATCLIGLVIITVLTNLATGWTRSARA